MPASGGRLGAPRARGVSSVPSCGVSEIRVLCVCTHNQTRSVIAAALVDHHLRALGVPATVTSAGVRAGGVPPTEETVRLLGARGLDVSGHRSRRIDDTIVTGSDLILTAERDHVVHIAGRNPSLFSRTFTLPEVVERGERIGVPTGHDWQEWLDALRVGRPSAFDYLDTPVPEVADPTGRSRRAWTEALATIDDLSERLARLLHHVVPGSR